MGAGAGAGIAEGEPVGVLLGMGGDVLEDQRRGSPWTPLTGTRTEVSPLHLAPGNWPTESGRRSGKSDGLPSPLR